MNKLLHILFLLCFCAGDLMAQDRSDSLNTSGSDSARKGTQIDIVGSTHKQFEDTLNQRTVVMTFEDEKLKTIHYRVWVRSEVTESATFHVDNDSLVYVEYTVSGPDIRSSLPPTIVYLVYFKNDKQTGSEKNVYRPGSLTLDGFSLKDRDFIKEFYYYKGLTGYGQTKNEAIGHEQAIRNIKAVFEGYVKYPESTDSSADEHLMIKSVEALDKVTDQNELDLLINVWMYYDPTDFPGRNLVYRILENNRPESVTAVKTRISKKKEWETDDTAPYSELKDLLKRLEN